MSFRRVLGFGALPFAFGLLTACENTNEPTDAQRVDVGAVLDGGPTRVDGGSVAMPDSGPAMPDAFVAMRPDATATCGAGQHACGAGCVNDQANEPANGCRFGCGEPCPAPMSGGASACNAEGQCVLACTLPYRLVGNECVCAPSTCDDMGAMCGAPDDGCGHLLNCGACTGGSCVEGRCMCDGDRFEPNNIHTALTTSFGALSDSANTRLMVENGTLHNAADVDWYRFDVTDGTDLGSPVVTVTLSQIPAGSEFEVAAYYTCPSGDPASTTCREGTIDRTVGTGCVAPAGSATRRLIIDCDCGNLLDQSGVLFVRVSASRYGASACTPYLVNVAVD